MNNSSRVESTIGRADEIDEVTSCVLRWGQKRLPVIVGESGVGKTNLLHAVALKLSKHRGPLNLISLDFGCVLAGTLFDAERENLLSALLKEAAASPATVLALERFELAARGPHGPLLLAQSLDNHMPLIGTSLPKYLPGFERAPLARRLNIVGLEELSPSETLFVLRAVRKSIARHHDVEIDETCIRCCVHAARSLPGYFPAKAIALLDAAGGKASLSDANAIRPDDVYSAVGRPAEGRESDGVGSP